MPWQLLFDEVNLVVSKSLTYSSAQNTFPNMMIHKFKLVLALFLALNLFQDMAEAKGMGKTGARRKF